MNLNYSVLMSVYYKEKPHNLEIAINSMLDQTLKANDFVLICDGPLTMELNKVIDTFVMKHPTLFNIIRLQENSGLGNALNIGLKECKNEFIARMDSDDYSLEDRCEQQIEFFANNPNCSVLSGGVAEFDESLKTLISYKRLPYKNEEIIYYSKLRNPVNHPCVMYKKSAIISAGSYQDFYLLEDYYLWIRVINKGLVISNLSNILLHMRAGSSMYLRRSGYKYFKSFLRLRQYQLSICFISYYEYIISIFLQGIIILIPNKIRYLIYSFFLRSSKNK